MIENVNDLLSAHGLATLQPLGFSDYNGKYLYETPDSFCQELANKTGIPVEQFLEKRKESEKLLLERQEVERTQFNRPIQASLFNHQKDFVSRFGASDYGALFADMGTGKTRAMLELLSVRLKQRQEITLILCPKTVLFSWEKEISTYYPKLSFILLIGTVQQRLNKLSIPRRLYLINYEALRTESIFKAIYEKGFEWIILDESQKIKNPIAKVTKKVMSLGSIIPRRFLLTGTPVTNKEIDIFSQITFLDRGKLFGTNFYRFRQKWFKSKGYQGYEYELPEYYRKNFQKALDSISIRVKKEDCLDLPEQTYSKKYALLSGDNLEAYESMKRDSLLVLKDKELLEHHKIVQIKRLHQITGGGIGNTRFNPENKLEALSEIIQEIESPLVIIAVYTAEILAISNLLSDKKMTHGIIAGSVKDQDRSKAIKDFSENKLEALILQIHTGGLGVDGLQNFCNTMIFYSTDYRWDSRVQTEARIHRSGQKNVCTYVDIISILPGPKPTVEQAIQQAVKNKDFRIKALIDHVIKDIS